MKQKGTYNCPKYLLGYLSTSDFNNHICNFFFLTEKVKEKQIAYSKVAKKDTKVLSEYHNMASWNRKEINEIHPYWLLTRTWKSEISLVERNKGFSFGTYFKCLSLAKSSKSMMLTTFGWMCEAKIKAPMCILMTNTGFEKLDCPFIHFFSPWQIKLSSPKRTIIQHSTIHPNSVTELVTDFEEPLKCLLSTRTIY